MSQTPASAYDIEALLARRARPRPDGRVQLRAADREEPKLAPAEYAPDADMSAVVQKFEQIYATLDAQQDERRLQPDLAQRAAAAFSDPSASSAGDMNYRLDHTAPESVRFDVAEIDAAPGGAIDRFELPEADTIPRAAESYADRAPFIAATPARRGLRPVAIAGACLALVIGTAVGYVMAPGADSAGVPAKIETTQQGGTQLRIDYTLPKP